MSPVTFASQNGLGEIVLDSPPLNLFDLTLIRGLRAAADAAASSEVRAVLLRAEGAAFSAGADVSIFAGLDDDGAGRLMTEILELTAAIEAITVPTMALVHGHCFAGALEMALGCDIVWAAAGTKIGQVEALIGGIPFAGGAQRIAARVGATRAAEIVFGAGVYSAEHLEAWGLITRVVDPTELLGDGRALARQLADGPTQAHIATKRILREWRNSGVDAADEVTGNEGVRVIATADLQNGVQSMLKSGPGKAQFSGR